MATNAPDGGAARADAIFRPLVSIRDRLLAAGIATAVLVAGYMARPEEPIAARLEETPGPLLQQVVEQRTPQTVLRALQQAGASSLQFVARVQAAPRPLDAWSDLAPAAGAAPVERYGVAVGAGEILADGTGLRIGDAVAVTVGDGRQVEGTVTALFPDRRLALLAVEATAPLVVPPQAAIVAPGDAVVAVAPGADGQLFAPLFVAGVTRDGIRAASPLDGFLGMGVFNEAAALVGIVARAGAESRILPLPAALAPVPVREPPPPFLGVALRLEPAAADTAGAAGVEVADLAPDGAAARLGLRPGDLLLDDREMPVASVEGAVDLLMASIGAEGEVRVRRDGRTVTLRPAPAPADPTR